METMPECQEKQCAQLTVVAIIQESKTFVNILGDPVVRLYIKTVNIMLEASCIFKHNQFYVRTSRPIDDTLFISTIECNTYKSNANQSNVNKFVLETR